MPRTTHDGDWEWYTYPLENADFGELFPTISHEFWSSDPYGGWLRNPNHQLKTVAHIYIYIYTHLFIGYMSFHISYWIMIKMVLNNEMCDSFTTFILIIVRTGWWLGLQSERDGRCACHFHNLIEFQLSGEKTLTLLVATPRKPIPTAYRPNNNGVRFSNDGAQLKHFLSGCKMYPST